jgi:hypothetical protein
VDSSIRRKFNHLKSGSTCQDYPVKPIPSQIDCTSLRIPSIKPCFYLHWGDSSQDILETEDFEVLILSVCNPYRNINFKNILISKIEVFHDNGTPVELLPDGTPSVLIVPSKLICVCCIDPCSCSHIELSLKTNSAIAGKYKIKITYCIDEIILLCNYLNEVEFGINLITS